MRWRVVALVSAAIAAAAMGAGAIASRPPEWGTLARARSAPDSGYEAITITSTTGRRLDCLVRSSGTGRRGVVLAGGQLTGKRAVRLLPPTFTGVALSCDYLWASMLDGALPKLRGELVATPAALALAASYLRSRPDVDPARLAAVGVSVGVPPVSAWAARDTSVRAVALLYGGAELWRPMDLMLRRHVKVGWVRGIVARAFGAWLRPLEPARTAGGIRVPLLIVGSKEDQRIPEVSTDALVRAANDPTVVWLTGVHLHPTEQALLAVLADTTQAWLDRVLP